MALICHFGYARRPVASEANELVEYIFSEVNTAANARELAGSIFDVAVDYESVAPRLESIEIPAIHDEVLRTVKDSSNPHYS